MCAHPYDNHLLPALGKTPLGGPPQQYRMIPQEGRDLGFGSFWWATEVQPVLTGRSRQPLAPGERVAVEIELYPASTFFAAGIGSTTAATMIRICWCR